MDKKVGRFIFLCLLFLRQYAFASDSKIILAMFDMNHAPLEQAMMNAPFMIELELMNIDNYPYSSFMQYMNSRTNFKIFQGMTSENIHIENGKTIKKILYNFIVKADKKGNFTVGPIQITDKNNQIIRSNNLIVQVGDEMVVSDAVENNTYFMTMSLDKKQAYVGEKITATISFYDRLFVDDLQLQVPEFENVLLVKNPKYYTKTSTIINNQSYSLTQWLIDIYVSKEGIFLLEGIQAAFFAPAVNNKRLNSNPFDLFRVFHKTEKSLIVNPVKIEILPLPEESGMEDVSIVGSVTNFTVTAEKKEFSVGQGIMLTAEIFGDINFETMRPLSLNLPEGLQAYDADMVKISQKKDCKHSEYILQAHAAGQYSIPSQILTYFDPSDRLYKKIQSESFTLDVKKDEKYLTNNDDLETNHEDHEASLDEQRFKKITSLKTTDVHERKSLYIPFSLFFKFLWLWLFILISSFIYRFYIEKYIQHHPGWIKFKIFYRAIKSCKKAISQKNVIAIHTIFQKLFSQLLDVSVSKIDSVAIEHYLIEKKFSSDQIIEWKLWYVDLLKFSFAAQDDPYLDDFLSKALYWIYLLKERA